MAADRRWLSNIAISAPASEPITLAEARAHSRLDQAETDAQVGAVIAAARDYVEALANRPLVKRQFRMTRAGFPAGREFALPSARAISLVSIAYLDAAGSSQTLSLGKVTLDADRLPGIVRLNRGEAWPDVVDDGDGAPTVTVTYWAGWENAAAVPASLLQAVRLAFGHLWETREAAGEKPVGEHDHALLALVAPYTVAMIE